MPFVTAKIQEERMSICRSCRHFKSTTASCGPLGIGKKVKHQKKDVKLCGCIMPIKTRLRIADCPLNLWSPQYSLEDIERYRELKARSAITNKLEVEDQLLLKRMYESAFDTVWTPTNCSACYRNMITALDGFLYSSEKEVGRSMPSD